jgi:hypothetical protein
VEYYRLYYKPKPEEPKIAPTTKTCKKCGETKAFELFEKDKNKKFGRRHSCKKCANERNKKPKQHQEPPLTRVCRKCSTEKNLSEFFIVKSCKHGKGHICKECKNKLRNEFGNLPHNKIKQAERWKIYREKNKERINEQLRLLQRKLYANNPEKYKEKKRIYRIKNKEKIKERNKEIWKKQIETLSENYLKTLLHRTFKLCFKDVTDEQLQLQKESILLHREFKQLKQQLQ